MAVRRWLVGGLVAAGVVAGCSAPEPPPPGPRHLPVFYVADTPAGPRLYREFHQVMTDDPASAAVRELLAAPTGVDPDYRNLWPAGVALRGPVAHADTVVTVDLTGPAPAGTTLAVAQLVHTVQDALGTGDPVRILVDGVPLTPQPVPRGDDFALRSLVQIDTPRDGATVTGDVDVRGEAAVYEATLRWEVLRDGVVVDSGAAATEEGQVFAPFRFVLALEPGTYTVRIAEDDPSGGEGRPPLTDDKTVVVRPS